MDIKQIQICKATPEDCNVLTEISFEAKRHWNYPDHYFEIWHDELTITEEYIQKNIVFVARNDTSILGFYSITHNPNDIYSGEIFIEKGYWLEHIFIKPEFHYKGIGKLLIEHAKETCRLKEIDKLLT